MNVFVASSMTKGGRRDDFSYTVPGEFGKVSLSETAPIAAANELWQGLRAARARQHFELPSTKK